MFDVSNEVIFKLFVEEIVGYRSWDDFKFWLLLLAQICVNMVT